MLPRPGPAQPPQIIGRPSDVERLLDEAGQRAQEVERGAAQAVEETAAVAAEEGKVAVAAEGVGGAFPVPGSHAGACLRPALTSWHETSRLPKKNPVDFAPSPYE